MDNLVLGIVFALVNFSLFLIFYRLFGKAGLYAWIGVATIIANIQVVKTIEMLGIVMTLGNTIYGTIYMTTDLLNEKYGEKYARKGVWFGFTTLIMTTIIMQFVLLFTPQAEDIAQGALETIFGLMPRIVAGSMIAYLVSQYLDVKIFSFLRKYFPKRHQLWIRNNGSTMISQLVDSFIFVSIAFIGVFSTEIWMQILISTYLIKFVITIASTPFIYIARSFKVSEDI